MVNYHGESKKEEYIIPFKHIFRQELGLKPNTYCSANIELDFAYDRVGCCTCTWFRKIEVFEEGKHVANVKLQRPWTQRMWSETELVDIGKEAGFTDFKFFITDFDIDGHDLEMLDNMQRALSKNKKDLIPTHMFMSV